jgi:hypothetical protein
MAERAAKAEGQANFFTAADVEAILREQGRIRSETEDAAIWMAEAASMLGPHAEDREALTRLLSLVFEYDAHAVLALREAQEVLTREGAREVLRSLATEILSGGPVDSARLKDIVAAMRGALPYSSRELFHPLRLAQAGRVGGGELDRVVLLLDRAAGIEGLAPVKSVRTRILEFCAALD